MSSYNPFSLTGKTILVTGASSGIGQATAIECSKLGARLVITGRNGERLQETFSQMEGEGHLKVVADLAAADGVEKVCADIPALDGLVCNAGIAERQLIPFFKEEVLRKIFEINTISPMLMVHKFAKLKKFNKGASVVFTSSIAGRGLCAPGSAIYSATKGAVSAFVRNAALELAAKKIRFNSVAPGMVETPLKDSETEVTEEQWIKNRDNHPLKRFGTPNDIAHAIIYLLSDASSWVTGAEIVVDGGRSLK